MTQENLLEMISRGDPKAFTVMYDMYARSLYSVIFNLVKQPAEAEEILTEVFEKAWKNIDTYNADNGRFFTWLLVMARRASIDKLRLKGYNDNKKNLSPDCFVQLSDKNMAAPWRMERIGIRDFAKKLRPKCIQMIDLLFYKGYSQQEAADELEMSGEAVKLQNRSCIMDLRNYLELQ